MIHQLIYSSAARPSLDGSAVKDIAEYSNARNTRLDITGMLMIIDGTILQIMEGERSHVEALYQLISLDRRHSAATILIQRDIETREFPQWRMGYDKMSEDEAKSYLSKISPAVLASFLPQNPSPEVKSMTKAYALVSGMR